jgi:hypothetical protein
MTREEMLKAGTTASELRSKVRYPDKYGGGYMVTLEVAHQLHCLVSYTTPTICSFLTHTSAELASPSHLVRLLRVRKSFVSFCRNSPSASW